MKSPQVTVRAFCLLSARSLLLHRRLCSRRMHRQLFECCHLSRAGGTVADDELGLSEMRQVDPVLLQHSYLWLADPGGQVRELQGTDSVALSRDRAAHGIAVYTYLLGGRVERIPAGRACFC